MSAREQVIRRIGAGRLLRVLAASMGRDRLGLVGQEAVEFGEEYVETLVREGDWGRIEETRKARDWQEANKP